MPRSSYGCMSTRNKYVPLLHIEIKWARKKWKWKFKCKCLSWFSCVTHAHAAPNMYTYKRARYGSWILNQLKIKSISHVRERVREILSLLTDKTTLIYKIPKVSVKIFSKFSIATIHWAHTTHIYAHSHNTILKSHTKIKIDENYNSKVTETAAIAAIEIATAAAVADAVPYASQSFFGIVSMVAFKIGDKKIKRQKASCVTQ